MRKISLFAVAAALILTGFGGWVATSSTRARVATPTSIQIDALRMMTLAGNLPTEKFVDYSLVYE